MISIGDVVDGKVISVMPFGAFVGIGNNQSGLVHISEVSNEYVKDVNEHIKKGDSVKVKVIKIDEHGKISLSIKQAMSQQKQERVKKTVIKENKPVRPADVELFTKADNDLSFEDKLSKFKLDSDEKIQALKKSADSKRSGGYSRKGGFSF